MSEPNPHPVAPPPVGHRTPVTGRKRLGTGAKVLIGCGGIAVALVVAILGLFVVIGTSMEMGHMPDTRAVPAGKIPSAIIDKLRAMGIVDASEKVLYFYSGAFWSIEGDGNLFTDRRVISYQQGDQGLEIYSATYDEITDLEYDNSDTWADDSTVTVYTADDGWFVLLISTEAQRDDDFFAKLKRRWEAEGGNEG